nr:MAG TPA: hypothetical protein [Caudoviricetes sp.]
MTNFYIYFTKGIATFTATKGSFHTIDFYKVSQTNFLLRWFDSSRRLMTAKK